MEKEGLVSRLSRLGDTALSIVQTRLALLGIEAQEEALRLGALLFNLVLAALFCGFAVLALAVFLSILFWDEHRLWAAGLSTLLFFVLAGWTGLNATRLLRSPRRLFTDSVAELQRDREALRGGMENER